MDLELRTYDQESFQQASVVNCPNDYEWTRITEFKKFSSEVSEKTTVCYEYPKSEGEPYYIVMTEDNINKKNKYMELVNKIEKDGKHIFIGRLAEYTNYNMDQVVKAVINKLS